MVSVEEPTITGSGNQFGVPWPASMFSCQASESMVRPRMPPPMAANGETLSPSVLSMMIRRSRPWPNSTATPREIEIEPASASDNVRRCVIGGSAKDAITNPMIIRQIDIAVDMRPGWLSARSTKSLTSSSSIPRLV